MARFSTEVVSASPENVSPSPPSSGDEMASPNPPSPTALILSPPPRRLLWVALAVAAVVVVVVAVLFVTGAFGGTSSSGPSVLVGVPESFVSAYIGVPAAANVTGGPWSFFAAAGFGVPSNLTESNYAFLAGSGCNYTPAPGAPRELILPGTPANATPGEVSAWAFLAFNPAHSVVLWVGSGHGHALPIVEVSGSQCLSAFQGFTAFNASSVLDSTSVAPQFQSDGASAFSANHTVAVREMILFGGTTSGGPPAWALLDSTCPLGATVGSGSQIEAAYTATDGTRFLGPTASTVEC